VENVFAHLIAGDRELRTMRDEIFALGRDPSHDERLRLGQLFEQRHERERDRLQAGLIEALEPVVQMLKKETPRQMERVAQLALLMERDEVETLCEHIEPVAARFGPTYAFEVAGPWPPFNFVELSLPED
jgi:hypothetical protein